MTPMQIHELTFCAHHKRGFIVLEDAQQRLTLAFDVHPDEVPRLARMLKGSQRVVHPLHDFIQSILTAFQLTPTDIILDDAPEKGLLAFVHVHRDGTVLNIPCYAPDALALAGHMRIPIYATERALAHAEPRSKAPNPMLSGDDVQSWLDQVKPVDFQSEA